MDWIGKMSPYCTLGVGGVTRKTRVVKDGGMKPRWGQSFAFSVAEGNQFLMLRCWDKARLGLDILFMIPPPAPRTHTRARSPATGGGEARGGFSAAVASAAGVALDPRRRRWARTRTWARTRSI